MATAEPAARPHDRHTRRRPFSSWMKRLANLKNSTSANSSSPQNGEKKHNHIPSVSKAKKHWNGKNNPYPESGHLHKAPEPSILSGNASSYNPGSDRPGSFGSNESFGHNPPLRSNRSAAPTLATNAETVSSDAGRSKAGTSATHGGFYEGRANSTFSSPQHSQESLATTLTTIQSTTPSGMLANPNPTQQPPVQFSHQYPVSPPASAVPTHLQHLQPSPNTYGAATANNMLSDDASIMTLASSSKRRRRHSLDTDASVRALAPSSLFGNSRESLPLSVLSSNVNFDAASALSSSRNQPSVSGLASAERASVYSASGVGAPALVSERNSYYSAKQGIDGASVRSGFLGHGRTESINGSFTGLVVNSPLNSPRDVEGPLGGGRSSRRTSEWKEGGDGNSVREEEREESLKEVDVDSDADMVERASRGGKLKREN
ncbi:hypothetical protein EJ08DRAFT_648602 [Tothia fuscella]|uniref:Uncharacterized protein n=1 Tax=Tothia fuscella TaxID=1048955 RepID=A0A9P4TZS5_9PEZI|nr:hypothetical protein EJ08DRAFT_648602 [Tothia fuscella]